MIGYRKDWSLKPAGAAYRDLVLGERRTDEKGTANAQGTFSLPGFLGIYDLDVSRGTDEKCSRCTLEAGGSQVVVTLG